jgi:hypothetical protein
MKDDETFDEFYACIKDIVNSSFNLGKKILDYRIVRKIMRSLPEKIRPKVTANEVVEEVVGFLQNYELTLPRPKKNNLASKIVRKKANNSTDEDLALLAMRFKKSLKLRKGDFRRSPKSGETFKNEAEGSSHDEKKFKRKKEENTQPSGEKLKNDAESYHEKKRFKGKKEKNTPGIKCQGCLGFGHITADCPNYKRSKGKTMNVTLRDESSDDTNQPNDKGSFMAFTASLKSGDGSSVDDTHDQGESCG